MTQRSIVLSDVRTHVAFSEYRCTVIHPVYNSDQHGYPPVTKSTNPEIPQIFGSVDVSLNLPFL